MTHRRSLKAFQFNSRTIILITLTSIIFFSLFSYSLGRVEAETPVSSSISNRREIKLDINSDVIKIESLLQNETQQDSFEFKIFPTNTSGLEIRMEYKSQSNSENISAEFQLKILSLLEIWDNDSNGKYEPGSDEVLQSFPLLDLYMSHYEEEENAGVILYSFYIQDITNTFETVIYISEDFLLKDSFSILPTQIKMDLIYNDFPFQAEDSDLVLEMKIESTYDITQKEETEDEANGLATDESGIIFTQNNWNAFFTWTNQAFVDGIINDVGINLHSLEETEWNFYFLYPQGDHILHDPKIGVENTYIFNQQDNPIENPTETPTENPNGGFIGFLNSIFRWPNSLIFIGLGIALMIGLIMSKQEYRAYLMNRVIPLHTYPHRLSMEDVLENDIRNTIINLILEEPGIHYSELLRQIDTSASNLAWHLDILETYKVIHKHRIGKFLIFYPYLEKNPFTNLDPTIAKSKTTLEIFDIIGENPGIYQGKIAKRLDINRKSVQYHLDKLEELHLIRKEKEGRKYLLYLNEEEE